MSRFLTAGRSVLAAAALATLAQAAVAAPAHLTAVYTGQHKAKLEARAKADQQARASKPVETATTAADRSDGAANASDKKSDDRANAGSPTGGR